MKSSYQEFESATISILDDYFMNNHMREIPENIFDILDDQIQTNNLQFKKKFIDSATTQFLNYEFPILCTQKNHDDMISLGYKLWEKYCLIIHKTTENKTNKILIDEHWVEVQYANKMIVTDDLTRNNYLDFLFGIMFVNSIEITKDGDKYYSYGYKYVSYLYPTFKWKLSKKLIMELVVYLIRINIEEEQTKLDYETLKNIIGYFPDDCHPEEKSVIKEIQDTQDITVIGLNYPVSQSGGKTVGLPLENMQNFSKTLDDFSRKIYPIDIIDMFYNAFGFYPKYVQNDNVYGIITDCYIGKQMRYQIVVSNSIPKNSEYKLIVQELNEKVIRYLSGCKIKAINLSLYVKYFSIFAFSIDKESISDIHETVNLNGITYCQTNNIFIDECAKIILDNITDKNINEDFLYREYRKIIAPETVFVSAYIPSVFYSELKSNISRTINVQNPKPKFKKVSPFDSTFKKLYQIPNANKLTSIRPSKLNFVQVETFDNTFNTTEYDVFILNDQHDNFETLWLEYSNYIHETLTEIESLELLLVTWRTRNFINDLQKALMLRHDEYKQHSFDSILGIVETIDSLENMDHLTFYRTYLGFFFFLSNRSIVQLPYAITKFLNLWSFDIEVWFSKKPLVKAFYTLNKRRSLTNSTLVYSVLATCTNIDAMYITEHEVEDAMKIVNKELLDKSHDNVIKKIRDLLTSLGNINILSHEEYKSKALVEKPEQFLDDYINKPEFKYLCKSAKLFMENNSQSIDTRKKEMQLIVKFFQFLEENHFVNGTLFEKILLEPIFSGDVELTLHNWIKKSITKSDQNKVQNVIAQICERSPYLAGAFKSIYRKNYSKKQKTSMLPSRNALDEEVLLEMRNIVLNNPPISTYYENKIDEKGLWYKHVKTTQPMLPAMLLLHIKMPHRAEHIRTLDLNKFFIKDEDGNFLGLEISTDKNWRRADIFTIDKEIVNIMFDQEELDFIQKCNEYIYQYFDQIRPVYQKGDVKNIWGQIVPMFPNKHGTDFLPKEVYRGYYFKVLTKALLSLGKDIQNYIQPQGNTDIRRFMENLIHTEAYEVEQEEYLSKKMKSSHYGPHSLRKSNITRYISYGHPLEVIIAMTGHKSLNTVMSVYVDYNMLAKTACFIEAREVLNKDISVENPIHISREYIKVIGRVLKTGDSKSLMRMLNKLQLSPPPSILDENSNLVNNEYGLSKCLETNVHIWKPMPWGICTAIECPINIVEKCAACPHLLTNELFMRGIKLAVLASTSKIAKIANSLHNNMKKGELDDTEYADHTAFQKDQIIDFYSWQLLIDDLHEKIYSNENIEHEILPQVTANQIDYNMGLIEVFTEAKACYYGSRDVDAFTDELAGKVLRLLVQKKITFDNIPLDNQESLLAWFIDYIDNSDSIERENIIKSLKDPKNNYNCLLPNSTTLS